MRSPARAISTGIACWTARAAPHVRDHAGARARAPPKQLSRSAEAARSRGIKISFDGNYRGTAVATVGHPNPKAILGELVAEADILFGNHRDISLLLGREFGGDGEDGGARRPRPPSTPFPMYR